MNTPDVRCMCSGQHSCTIFILCITVKTVDEFVKDLHLDTFSDLLEGANLTRLLKGSKNITLLAPTDRAFRSE